MHRSSIPPPEPAISEWSVLSLNVAHGRGMGWHQALLKRKTIQANLDAVAGMLLREAPAVVALQEADGQSIWSGRFNHVSYLSEVSKLPHSVRGEHVRHPELSYGTALLSNVPLHNARP